MSNELTAKEMFHNLGFEFYTEYNNKLIYHKRVKSKYDETKEIFYSIGFNTARLTVVSWFYAPCMGDIEDAYKLMTGEDRVPRDYFPNVSNLDFVDYDLSLAITKQLKELSLNR